MHCTNCGEETKGKVCLKCGVKQNKVHNFCRWCGETVVENAVICPQCGEQIKPKAFASIMKVIAAIVRIPVFSIFLLISFSYLKRAPLWFLILVFIGLAGLILSLPKTTGWIEKITHKKNKLRKIFKATKSASIFVLFIIYCITLSSADKFLLQKENEKIYLEAVAMIETAPLEARGKLAGLDDYKDSREKIEEVNSEIYKQVNLLLKNNSLDKAKEYFEALPEDYEDSLNLKSELQYQTAQEYMRANNYMDAKKLLQELGDYKNSKKLLEADVFALIGNQYDVEVKVKKVGYNSVYNLERLSFNGEKVNWHTAVYKKTPYATSYEQTESIDNELDLLVKDGSIYLSMNDKDVKLTVVNYEKGRVLAFIWNGSLFELTE